MGDPKRRRKQYETPRKTWDRNLLYRERKLVDTYGLKNKKELRRHETWLRNKRKLARGLLALQLEKRVQREKELIGGLAKIGVVKGNAILDDVLSLKVEELLEKRLQTTVFRKGMANSVKQARQFIIHGHIAVNGNKVSAPSYMVHVSQANYISWFKKQIKTEEKKSAKTKAVDLKKEFEESMKQPEIQETIGEEQKAGIVQAPASEPTGEDKA